MLTLIRSLGFQIAYWGLSIFFVLTALPLLLLPGRKALMGWIRAYTKTMVAAMRHIAGIQTAVRGHENLPDGPFIVAAKHQRWGDGFVVFSQIPDLAFVTGDHLLRMPFLGPLLRKMGAIVVDNCGGAHARGQLVSDKMETIRSEGRRILIYPEGHLSDVGTQHRYRKGVYHIYEQYGCPVVPVATDLGVRWPKQSWLKTAGPASVEFLDPIPPGLDKDSFMAELEAMIETRSLALLEEQRAAGTLPAPYASQTPLSV
ncbi:MAG: lysophospholipid acyltransferase family protein [Pseudomonadota bacterium]